MFMARIECQVFSGGSRQGIFIGTGAIYKVWTICQERKVRMFVIKLEVR